MSEPLPAEVEEQARAALVSGELERAEALARNVIDAGEGTLAAWEVLVTSLRWQGRHREALLIQQMLVEQLPGQLSLRFDLAETLLLLGDFERGWREYQYRYSLAHTREIDRKVQRPEWNGQPLPGKTLLIHDEQGYGDTFQFLRMAQWAGQRSGARVIVQINHEQATFARRMTGIDRVILRGELPGHFDMHCRMMSLPRAMKLKLEDLPGPMPYLSPDPSRCEYWRSRLGDLPRPLVALVWAGSTTHGNDANRSLPLAALAPIGASGVSFLSVQKGPAAAQAATAPEALRLTDLSEEIRDFDDTAAILSVCDLLISVDSSPVHLAGALNCPAWLLLPFVPDWRWLLDREDTPWYPSVKLFRQSRRGDWSDVIARLADELGRLRR